MKKKVYIIYSHEGKIKKAVLDENLYRQYQSNPEISNMMEYESEMLMERRYAEALGISGSTKQFLLG